MWLADWPVLKRMMRRMRKTAWSYHVFKKSRFLVRNADINCYAETIQSANSCQLSRFAKMSHFLVSISDICLCPLVAALRWLFAIVSLCWLIVNWCIMRSCGLMFDV